MNSYATAKEKVNHLRKLSTTYAEYINLLEMEIFNMYMKNGKEKTKKEEITL